MYCEKLSLLLHEQNKPFDNLCNKGKLKEEVTYISCVKIDPASSKQFHFPQLSFSCAVIIWYNIAIFQYDICSDIEFIKLHEFIQSYFFHIVEPAIHTLSIVLI